MKAGVWTFSYIQYGQRDKSWIFTHYTIKLTLKDHDYSNMIIEEINIIIIMTIKIVYRKIRTMFLTFGVLVTNRKKAMIPL